MASRKQRKVNKKTVKQSHAPKRAERKQKDRGNSFLNFYDKNYMKLMIIPLIMIILAIGQIGFQYATTGDFMNKGVSLKGGLTITLDDSKNLDSADFLNQLESGYPGNEINLRKLVSPTGDSGIVIEADITDADTRDSFSDKVAEIAGISYEDMNVDVVGSALGESFFKQTFVAIIVAFILMGVVVFIYFRTFIPSMAVIISAFSDILITLAVINVLEIKISTAGIAAFLMLIGYSIDTDILLTTRVMKEKEGDVFERMVGAAKTGLTMSFSTIAAVIVAIVLSQSAVLSQIMIIMLVGLLVDIIMTWIQNVAILRYYMENMQK